MTKFNSQYYTFYYLKKLQTLINIIYLIKNIIPINSIIKKMKQNLNIQNKNIQTNPNLIISHLKDLAHIL